MENLHNDEAHTAAQRNGDHNQKDNLGDIRTINIILDDSSFTRGVGNIMRWFDEDKILTLRKKWDSTDFVYVNILIPQQTLSELKALRHKVDIRGTNSRQALQFIDEVFDKYADTPPPQKLNKGEYPQGIAFTVNIESEELPMRSWNSYQKHSVRTLTQEDVYLQEHQRVPAEHKDEFQTPAIASPPIKKLASSCIKTIFSDRNTRNLQWRVVSESPVVRLWLSSFGIECLNTEETERLLFSGRDISQSQSVNPGQNFNSTVDIYDEAEERKPVDTTSYAYESLNGTRVLPPVMAGAGDNRSVKLENFSSISYAPRDLSALWSPPGVASREGKKETKGSAKAKPGKKPAKKSNKKEKENKNVKKGNKSEKKKQPKEADEKKTT